ncbi:hypothetical protein [Streptomyces palmae]|uniref:FtsK domain-containing protein n=1 Tax=Streptomyces palmae TaxID=1701085 RepID=A0A4Z0HD62_9ACTN|nr:hypothetical protein [Streptomyces palmae]TGB14606.1 hypothetical protein E4099_08205 [Streptomyces palmae]
MTSDLPDRIIYEGEFVDDDQVDQEPSGGTGPATPPPTRRARITAALAAATLRAATREITAITTGFKVLKAERGQWLSASNLTDAHLRAHLLNHRYRRWERRQRQEAQRLKEKAEEAEERAKEAQRRARQEDVPEGYQRASEQAAKERAEAVAWRNQSHGVESTLYAEHREPSPEELAQQRRRTANRRRLKTAITGAVLAAVELYWASTLPLLTAGGAIVTVWAKGRMPNWRSTPPDVPALAYNATTGTAVDGATTSDGATTCNSGSSASAHGPAGDPTSSATERENLVPYPIREATTADEAAEALRRAILQEGGDVEAVTDAVEEPWGWSVRASFSSGSPDDLNEEKTYKGLITLLKVRRNGLLIEGDPEAGDSCTIRILKKDPFTAELVGTVPYRAPLSASISDSADFGVAMDATPLVFTLAGLMLLMVADSGGGKSGIMLAMAEVVTSTRDAVVINLDPVGTGVGDLGPAITLNATMDDALISDVLDFFLNLCTARAAQRAAYGWGNKWRVSPEHPAFCLFVDEWPQLSAKNKAKLIRLLLLGRKEAIWVYGGSQFGTKDYLGEAIGPKLAAKLIGASRRVDVTELLGGGALAEGYRADLIVAATHTERNDAGQIYATGLPGMPNRPLRYQVREILPEYAAKVGAERAAAGLPDVTHTLTEAGMIDQWADLQAACADPTVPGTSRSGTSAPAIVQTIRAAFTAVDDPEYLTMDQLHVHLRRDDEQRWGRWDDKDDRDRLRELGKALSRALRDAKVDLSSKRITELDGQPRGYYMADVQEAVDAHS